MSILDAIIEGIVGAMGEFLPISGSGHLAVLRNLFNMTGGQSHMLLDAMIHFGAVIAMLFVSWSELRKMFSETSTALRGEKPKTRSDGAMARLLLLVLTASLPLALMIPLGSYITMLSQQTVFVGAMFILNGVVLTLYPKFVVGETANERSISFSAVLVVGLCQCAALLPGMSRIAVIMTGCAALGMSRSFSVRFALLCSIPSMLGMAVYEMVTAFSNGVAAANVPAYIIAMVCSMLISVLAISIMRMLAKRKSFGGFAYYCWIFGVLTVILSTIF